MTIKYLAFDTETSGFQAGQDEILSIAAIPLDARLVECGPALHVHAFPSYEELVSEGARAVNGYNREEWERRGAVSQRELYDKVFEYVKEFSGVHPLGHNVSFDVRFIRALLSPGVYDKRFSRMGFCTLAVSREVTRSGMVKSASNKLEPMCTAMGIRLDGAAHDAMVDIVATVELAREFFAWGFVTDLERKHIDVMAARR